MDIFWEVARRRRGAAAAPPRRRRGVAATSPRRSRGEAAAKPWRRRGVAAVGRLLPVGIGAAVGGTTNYVAVRTLARHSDAFFARLPYSAIDVESIDITHRQLPA